MTLEQSFWRATSALPKQYYWHFAVVVLMLTTGLNFLMDGALNPIPLALNGLAGMSVVFITGLYPSLFVLYASFAIQQVSPYGVHTSPWAAVGLLPLTLFILMGAALRKGYLESNVAHQNIKEALEAKDELITLLAHELGSPMTAIKLQAQMVTKDLEGRQAQKKVLVLNKQVDRLAKLVNSLTDLSQIKSGQLKYEFKDFEFDQLIQDAVRRLQPAFPGCELHLKITEDDAWLYGDPVRIEQVLVNLITNACKYSDKSLVEICVEHDKSSIKLSVRDHGPGIPADRLESIFFKYERAGKIKTPGLGLGLYIARQIVYAHNGMITAKNNPPPDTGACFVCIFPRR